MRKLLGGAIAFGFVFGIGWLHVAAAPTQLLDQQQTGTDSSLASIGAKGQSFTAGISGTLTEVDVAFCSTTGAARLQIAAGDIAIGVPLPALLLDQVVAVHQTEACLAGQFNQSYSKFVLSPGVPVTKDSSYTFQVLFDTGPSGGSFLNSVRRQVNNPYGGGHFYSDFGDPNWDLTFITYVTVDSDGDGVCDPGASEVQCQGVDLCPASPDGAPVNGRGCSVTPADSDGDGVCNRGVASDLCTGSDLCSNTPASALEVDDNGCSQAQVDSDLDGVCNRGVSSNLCDGTDRCSRTASGAEVDSNGCAEIQVDSNLDGVCNRGATSDVWCMGVFRPIPSGRAVIPG